MNHHTDESLSAEEALAIFARVTGQAKPERQHAAAQSADDEPAEAYEHAALAVAERAMAALRMSAPMQPRQQIAPQRVPTASPAASAPQARTGVDGLMLGELNRRLAGSGFAGADGLDAAAWIERQYFANVAIMTGWKGLPTGQTPQSWGARMVQYEAEKIASRGKRGAS